jgi:hypothetical protein
MKGWPKPSEIHRQAWIATNAIKLADEIVVRVEDVIAEVKRRLLEGRAENAEDALLDMFSLWEIPAPEGQQHFIIKEGALVAPGEG